MESSVRSVIVDKLPPSTICTVKLEACSLDGCSGSLTTSAVTKPIAILEPLITGVSSNSTSSFQVTWTFPNRDADYYDGFLVLYCSSASSCRESYTSANSICVNNLSPDTIFDIQVRASIKRTDGRVELGPAAAAQVTTWKEVPLAPGLKVRASEGTSNALVLFWTFVNSTVDYLQVSMEENIWTNCSDDIGCDMAAMYGSRPEFKSGFIRLKNLVPYTTYSVAIRGCNDAGCGEESNVKVRTGMAAPREPVGLQISLQDSTLIIVTWQHPSVPAGPLSGYIASWQCPHSEKRNRFVEKAEVSLYDLPQNGFNCTLWVSGFNKTPEGRLLVGPATSLSL
ncbi:contactin-1 [Ixodes scapularis]|uniref:contactin-1 n=1 Tax=Ixodes scapularis TaxID=6945 RepID=UPI001C389AA5|nr:contactin-1 [Ixodes scapularis]